MELTLCFMGLGSVGRELIKLIDRKREDVLMDRCELRAPHRQEWT